MFKKREKGFTLIELMIVVAIIGILAAIAIPRFADLLSKAKEGATKGNLGAMRSALSIYYADKEGAYPSTLLGLVTDGYLDKIQQCNTKQHGKVPSDPLDADMDVTAYALNNAPTTDAGVTTDDGSWAYYRSTDGTKAGVFVECKDTTHTADGSKAYTW